MIHSGINGYVEFLAESGTVTKYYRSSGQDSLCRYLREKKFYQWAAVTTPTKVPIFFGGVPGVSITLEYIKGSPVRPSEEFHFQYFKFIKDLQGSLNLDTYSILARDSAFSDGDVIRNMERRLSAWAHSADLRLVGDFLLKRLSGIRRAVDRPYTCRLLSPSDAGAHNSLFVDSQGYKFFDFEYSGVDSADKFFFDYILHPKNSLPDSQIELTYREFKDATGYEISYCHERKLLFLYWWLIRLVDSLRRIVDCSESNLVSSQKIQERVINIYSTIGKLRHGGEDISQSDILIDNMLGKINSVIY